MRSGVQDQVNHRLTENGRILAEYVGRLEGCRVLVREGGWYAVVRIADELSDEEVSLRLLREDGVLVHPGYFYDFPAGSFLVLSLLPHAEAFRVGAGRLAARLRSLSADR
jgi:alanine-synthesizing transaminase